MEKKHNIDKYPGYPHYPASEDITRAKNNEGKERFESDETKPQAADNINDEPDSEVIITQSTDADVTKEDLQSLDQDMDTEDNRNLVHASLDSVDEDGDPLNEDGSITDVSGEGLDVPGSSDDDSDELIGEEDEENNYYSLGGDLHESQEENKGE